MSSSVASVTTAIFPVDTSKEPVIFIKGSACVPYWHYHIHQSGLSFIGGNFLEQEFVLSLNYFVSISLNYASA